MTNTEHKKYNELREKLKQARAISMDDIANAFQLLARRQQIAKAELELCTPNVNGLQAIDTFNEHIKQLLHL